ncbi:hypothetical protein ACHAXA_005939 [Cyclostephanos tholiformis]|uniref:subtilisin n=1 Tax=Cyclostephanos tholiformis TaxID=382380 RepID=A0ABD3RDQ3_9STRA
MKLSIIVFATSLLARAAVASLSALPDEEVNEKVSPRRFGQARAEFPSSSISLPAEEESNEKKQQHRRLGMTEAGAIYEDTVTYIVKFEDTAAASGDRCKALAVANGGTVGYVYKEVANGCSLTMARPEVGTQSGEIILSDFPKVAYFEEDRRVYAFEGDGEESNIFDSSSHIQTRQVNSGEYWNQDRIDQCPLPLNNQVTRKSANGVAVFILDTGIQTNHEDFAGLIGPSNCHFASIEAPARKDSNGHGTHVAATVCGRKSGVATDCRLCAVKVLNANGQGFISNIIAGIDHVVSWCKNNLGTPCVINMSLGMRGTSQMLTDAVTKAVSNGVTVVVAAGNSKENACYTSPARIPVAITVGSTNKLDARSPFSNYGSCVDVYAPGSDIKSARRCSGSTTTCRSYMMMSGTSMASPYVAGLAATIRSRNKSLKPADVRNEIVNKAYLTESNPQLRIATYNDCRG